jgi:hypothetical protein
MDGSCGCDCGCGCGWGGCRGLLLEKRGVVEGGRSMGTPVKAVGVGGWPVYDRFGNMGLSREIVNF